MRTLDRVAILLIAAPAVIWGLSILITLALGQAGCRIDEGSTHSCILGGVQLADFAYSTGLFAAWGGLFMLPLSVGFAMLWGLVRLLLLLVRLRSPRD